MPDKVIDVPGVGTVAFPDTMADDAIGKAITNNYRSTMPKVQPPRDPIVNGPYDLHPSTGDSFAGIHTPRSLDEPILDTAPLERATGLDNPQSTMGTVAQHVLRFGAGLTTPKNIVIAAATEGLGAVAAPAVRAVGPVLGYAPEAVASAAGKVAQGAHKVVGGYFGTMAGKGVYDAGKKGVQDYQAGKPIAGDVTDALLNAGVAGLGMKGLIHDGAPPADTQIPSSPAVVDHPMVHSGNESVAPLQGRLFPENEHTVPTASTDTAPFRNTEQLDLNFHPHQRDMFAQHGEDYNAPTVIASPVKESVAPEQLQLMPWQKSLFGTEPSDTVDSTPTLDHPVLNPMQGRLFSVKGEALPPQQGDAGLMSPEAEALSKKAQDVSQQVPSVPTEGLKGSDQNDAQVRGLEDQIRSKTGQVMRLNQLLQGNKVHAALERAIDETQSVRDPRAISVGSGLSPEDQKIVSIALGEKVSSVLTDDQVEKAYALRGKVLGDTPVLQNRTTASAATLQASREAIAKDLATTTDPALKAKLQAALEPMEDGSPKPLVYKPIRKNAPAVDLPAEHPEAPFAAKTFGAQYPEITLDNLSTALGKRPRSKDMGLVGKTQVAAPQTSIEGQGTVKGGAFGIDAQNNPKGINGDAKVEQNEKLQTAVRERIGQLGGQLREHVKAYQNLRDASKPSELVDQLKALHPKSLPKEVRELVKPVRSETSETPAASSASVRAQTPAKGNTPETSPTPTLRQAQGGLGKLYSSLADRYPEHLDNIQTIVQKAIEHFGEDTDGSTVGTYNALKTFKQGIEQDDPWAMRNAVKEIKRMTPYGDIQYRNAGISPKDIKESVAGLKNLVSPKFTPKELATNSDYAANALLSRYEKMASTNRSAYVDQLHSDELDRLVAEGDPDGSKGYHDRLEALRQATPARDLYAGLKNFVQKNEDRILASETRGLIRSANSTRWVNDLRMETALNKFSKDVDGWGNQASRNFIHKMELGLDQEDPVKNQIARTLRTALDDARQRINDVNGNFEEYLENYFPHIWSNVGKGQALTHQMRGMSGNESFLKNRELATLDEGIRQGLQPVTFNPLKLTMMRVEQMNRYAMKEQIKQDFISSNKATLIKGNEPVPDGWVSLEDRAFERAGGLGGKYYAPQAVAKVFNNFVSDGLSGKAVIPILNLSAYDSARKISNTMNQAQLGLSGLHGAFTLTNSVISEAARGMAQGVNGDVLSGLKTTLGALNVPGRYVLGKNLIAHLKDPNSFQEMSSLADAFQRAGGRIGTDKILGTAYHEGFKNAYKAAMDDALPTNKRLAAWGKTVAKGAAAVFEYPTRLIMDKWVPQLKVGAFAKMANEILADNGDKPSGQIDAKLQQAWDNVDDRFGQMVYDNLFWNKTTKDIAMLSTRAPGWNIGTYRGLGMGLYDLAKSIQDVPRAKRFQITDRTAYLGAVVATTMGLNAMVQMALTGNGPDKLVDYFYPKTGSVDANGEENRIMPKMYTYDYINAVHAPIETALHKVSPLVGTLAELHANKNFYGREIIDPGASLGNRMAQMVEYAGKQVLPFSVTNYQEAQIRGGSGAQSILSSALGANPAPKWAGRSSAENLAAEYHAQSMAQGGEEGDKFDKRSKFQQIQADLKNGKMTPEDLEKRVNSGEIPTSFLDHVFNKSQQPNLERWTGALSPHRAMEVFDRATPEEKQRLLPVLMNKLEKVDPEELPAFAQKINDAAMHSPDTHVFSVSQWSAAHPGEDEKAAETEARQKGYEVHP